MFEIYLQRTSAFAHEDSVNTCGAWEEQALQPGIALLQSGRKRVGAHGKSHKQALAKGIFVGDEVVSLIDYESADGQVLHAGDHGIVKGPGLSSLKEDRHRRVNVRFASMESADLLPSQFTKDTKSVVRSRSHAGSFAARSQSNSMVDNNLASKKQVESPRPLDKQLTAETGLKSGEQEIVSLKSLLHISQEDSTDATYKRLYCEPEAEAITPNSEDVQNSSLHSVVGPDGVYMISRLRDAARFNFSMERLREASIYPSKFLATDGTCASDPALNKGCARQSDDTTAQWCESLHKTGSGCGSHAEQAIADSHRRALVAASERKYNWTLILEDDAVLVRPKRWNQAFKRAWEKVPPETKIVRFSWCMAGNTSVVMQPTYADAGDFRLIQWTGYATGYRAGGCTSGYMVHRDIIPQMVGLFPCCCAVDCCYENDLYNRVIEGSADTKGMTIMMSMDSWGSDEYIVNVGNGYNYWGPQFGVMFQALGDLGSTRLAQLEGKEQLEQTE